MGRELPSDLDVALKGNPHLGEYLASLQAAGREQPRFMVGISRDLKTASSVQKMIQRLSSAPISVPVTFMDNLNVCLIQMAVYHNGRMLRRVLAVEEIEGFSERAGGVLTRSVFRWDPLKDEIQFRGRNNSYILEERIAKVAGYTDKREIYAELDLKTRVLDRMIEEKILDYQRVRDVVWKYYEDGVQGLPFTL